MESKTLLQKANYFFSYHSNHILPHDKDAYKCPYETENDSWFLTINDFKYNIYLLQDKFNIAICSATHILPETSLFMIFASFDTFEKLLDLIEALGYQFPER